jgi:hypothetical protein
VLVRAVVLCVEPGNSAQDLGRDLIPPFCPPSPLKCGPSSISLLECGPSPIYLSWNVVQALSISPKMWSKFSLSLLESGSSSYSCRRSLADTTSMCGNRTSHYIKLHHITLWRSGLGGVGCTVYGLHSTVSLKLNDAMATVAAMLCSSCGCQC